MHKAQRPGGARRSGENIEGGAREGGEAGEEVERWAGALRALGAFLRNVRFLLQDLGSPQRFLRGVT